MESTLQAGCALQFSESQPKEFPICHKQTNFHVGIGQSLPAPSYTVIQEAKTLSRRDDPVHYIVAVGVRRARSQEVEKTRSREGGLGSTFSRNLSSLSVFSVLSVVRKIDVKKAEARPDSSGVDRRSEACPAASSQPETFASWRLCEKLSWLRPAAPWGRGRLGLNTGH